MFKTLHGWIVGSLCFIAICVAVLGGSIKLDEEHWED